MSSRSRCLRDDVEEVVLGLELSHRFQRFAHQQGTLGLLAEALDLRQGAFQNFDAAIASIDLFLKVLDEVFWAVVNFFEVDEADFEIGDPLLITCFRFTDLLLVRLDDVPVRTGSIDIEFGSLVQQQSHDQGALGQGVVLRVIERQRGQGVGGVDRAGQGLAAAQEFHSLQGICHLRRVLGGWRLAKRHSSPLFGSVFAKGGIIEIAGLGPVFEKVRGAFPLPADNRRRAAGKVVDLADPLPSRVVVCATRPLVSCWLELRSLAMTWVEVPPSGVVTIAAKPPTCPGNPVIFPPGNDKSITIQDCSIKTITCKGDLKDPSPR